MQAGLRRNDGKGDRYILAIFNGMPLTLLSGLPRAGITGAFYTLPLFLTCCCFSQPCPVVIPAKVGIQENEAGMLGGAQAASACARPKALGCHSRWRGNGLYKPLDSSAACSRRGSTTYIHVGGPAPE